MSKISAYGALAIPAGNDVIPIVDVNDTTMAASGTTKKMTLSTLLGLTVWASGDTSGATDQAAITAAENAATVYGGRVNLRSANSTGTFWVTGLTKQSNTIWQGAGRMVTTIKLANAANADVVKGANFATLTGTGSQAGITAWSIRDLTIDGNRSNQTGASWGLRVYGYAFSLMNVTVTNCYSDGMWTEWAYAGTFSYGTRGDSLEALYLGVKCSFNGGWGWHNRGPHDSNAIGCVWFDNNQAGGTAGNLWCEDDRSGSQLYLAGGLQCSGCHSWGSSASWGVINDSFLIWDGGELEGATNGALLVRGVLIMSATGVYYLTPDPVVHGAGIQLGDDGTTTGLPSTFSYTSTQVRMAAVTLNNFAGAGRSSAALAWVSCNYSSVDVSCQGPTVTVAAASNGQAVNALTGGHLFVTSTSGYPGTGTIYVATSNGYAKCSYTSITAGGSPSFNGVTYVSGPGGNVATGGILASDPLGGTTTDIYSTVRIDAGAPGNSGMRGTLSAQQMPGGPTIILGYQSGAWHMQGPASNDLLNINTSTPSSPLMQVVGMAMQGWKAGYGGITSGWNPATGGFQPGTTAGAGSTIYSGTGAPNVTGSVAGDLYVRTDTPSTANQRLYMATAANTWSGII